MSEAGTDDRFDVVLFGATGVTGRRVGAYLAERAPELGATWAAAGRSAQRVEAALRKEGVGQLPDVIEADVADPPSLAAMAGRAKVVLNVVGPYTRFGEPVIEACIGAGAHYLDLSGEIPFVSRMIESHHAAALAAGSKVIQVCGFEALPVDIAVLLLAERARKRFGESLSDVDAVASVRQPPGRPRATDMISGGTFESMGEALADPAARTLNDPAALLPPGSDADAVRRRSPIRNSPRRGPDGSVIGPMAPAPFINPPIIHRTNALLSARDGQGLGPNLRYREGIALGGGLASLPFRGVAAGALGAMSGSMVLMSRAPASVRRGISKAMLKTGPSSGFGPLPERLAQWSWRFELTAKTEGGHGLNATVHGDGHPGYLATARMLGEAGLILADADANVPGDAGCLTPAAALGTAHLDRFAAAGLRFSAPA